MNSEPQYLPVGRRAKEAPFHQFSTNRAEPTRLERYQLLLWMIVSLLAGACLAIGHHFFYASFDGQRVDRATVNQDWIVRIGTGLAFLSTTLLSFTASTAFTQHQWLITRSRPLKIRQIDNISSILHNVFGFFTTRVWFRFPILTLLAGITWLLPIAAVFTPATITVTAFEDTTNSSSSPPQLYFDPNQYSNLQTVVRTDYVGPSPDTLRTAFGSGMTGQILPIPAAQPNMSYTLRFIGPALRCDHADAAVIQEVADAYEDQLTSIENEYRYIAWVPTSSGRYNLTLATDFLDLESPDAAHLYIIPNTSFSGPMYAGGIEITPEDGPFGYQDLLDCRLYNASYEALLNFSFPSQTLVVQSRELLNPVNVSIDIRDWYFGQDEEDTSGAIAAQAQRICYQSIMEALGRLLIGYEWWRDGFVTTDQTSWAMMSINWTDRETARQGVEELFQNITFSMMGTASLTMNSTIAEQNQVLVDVYTTFNIFDYNARDLWLAYGIAAGATLLCTLLGVLAIQRNGAVYQNLFSTFVRTARDLGLQELIEPSDNGAEPLPKDLADTSIRLRGSR